VSGFPPTSPVMGFPPTSPTERLYAGSSVCQALARRIAKRSAKTNHSQPKPRGVVFSCRAGGRERTPPPTAPPVPGRGNCPKSGRFDGLPVRWQGELGRDGMCPNRSRLRLCTTTSERRFGGVCVWLTHPMAHLAHFRLLLSHFAPSIFALS